MAEPGDTGADLDQAVAVLQGGVERTGMEAALRVIETWEQKLAASGTPELVAISDDLASLRVQLLTGEFDPAAVGQLMSNIGDQVRSVAASDVGAPVAGRLTLLADGLSDGGATLANR